MMSTRVCAVGEFTSKLAAAYLEHIAGNGGPTSCLREEEREGGGRGERRKEETQLLMAFRQLQLPVSVNQVSQMLEVVQKERPAASSEQGPPSSSSSSLTWGEFCVCSSELHSLLARQSQEEPCSLGQWAKCRGKTSPRRATASKCGCQHKVFLGGSCNPTSWRRDTAIPALQREGITYFDPQVDEWYPELIEIEEQAKQAASLLFFVVDNQTRAVASMVEIANFAGEGRDLVLVVEDIRGESPRVGEDSLSKREVEDLNRGRAFVRNLTEHGGSSLLEPTVEDAIRSAVAILQGSWSVSDYGTQQRPLRLLSCHSLGQDLRLLRQVFTMYDTERKGSLSMQEAELALRSLHISGPITFQLMAGTHLQLSSWQQHKIPFEDFCTLYAELKYQTICTVSSGYITGVFSYLTAPLRWIAGWLWPSTPLPPPPFCDVFLGGSCGSTSWRTDIVIPILRQYGVSFFNPQVPNWDSRLIPIEQQAKEQCSMLLFVVTGDTLSVASMVEVAYYIGQGRKIILCLHDIPRTESPEVDGVKLSQRALKDYNRGRAYLASIANKSRIPIYTNITDAALCTVYTMKGYKAPPIPSVPLSGTSV